MLYQNYQIDLLQSPQSLNRFVLLNRLKPLLNNDTDLYTTNRGDVKQLLINNKEFTQFIINNGFVDLFFN